jgi:hypothetical protein
MHVGQHVQAPKMYPGGAGSGLPGPACWGDVATCRCNGRLRTTLDLTMECRRACVHSNGSHPCPNKLQPRTDC